MLDLDLLEKLLSEAGAEEDWTVYQCDFCTKESACGFNGESLDCSRDECHHPMLLVDANLLAALHNAAPSLLALARAGRRLAEVMAKFDIDDEGFIDAWPGKVVIEAALAAWREAEV